MANLNTLKPNEQVERNPALTPGQYKLSVLGANAFKSKKDGSDVRVFEFLVDESVSISSEDLAPALPVGARASKIFYPDKTQFAAQLTVDCLGAIYPEKLPDNVDSLFNGNQLMRGMVVKATVVNAQSKGGKDYMKVTFNKVAGQTIDDIKKNRARLDKAGM